MVDRDRGQGLTAPVALVWKLSTPVLLVVKPESGLTSTVRVEAAREAVTEYAVFGRRSETTCPGLQRGHHVLHLAGHPEAARAGENCIRVGAGPEGDAEHGAELNLPVRLGERRRERSRGRRGG